MVSQHLGRAVLRISVLVTVDLATVYISRALARAFVEMGGAAAAAVDRVFPLELVDGWQYALALVLCLSVSGTYAPGDHRRDPRRLLKGVALAGGLALWSAIWSVGPARVLAEYLGLSAVMWVALVFERRVVDMLTLRLLPDRRGVASRMILVATKADRDRLQASRIFHSPADLREVGWVDLATPPDASALGGSAQLGAILHRQRAEAVVVGTAPDASLLSQIGGVAMAAGCELYVIPRGMNLPGIQPEVIWSHGQPLLRLTTPSKLGWQLVVKRAMDQVGAAVGLVLTSPLFAAIAIAIKRDSPGPVFFTQERVGQGGRRFRIYKFRTMVVDAELLREALAEKSVYRDGRLFKVPDDPRITKVGRFLRRTSLDELPQLWNVVGGEMSLVGPRPPIPSEVELYEQHHYARFEMKPGLTGPWQVAGRNEITDFDQVVALEADYVRRWSLLEDVLMLLRTVPVVLRRHGAY